MIIDSHKSNVVSFGCESDYHAFLQNNPSFTGTVFLRFFHCKREWTMVYGKLHGTQFGWHENGQKAYEGNYNNGVEHGKQCCWYDNGQKAFEHNYVNDVEHGTQFGWHENGQKAYEHNYVNGVEHGKQYEWDENGQLIHEEDYENGQEIIAK